MPPPPPPDRITLPLLRTAALVGLGLSAWPAFAAGGPRWAWPVTFAAGVLGALLVPHPFRALGCVPWGLALGGAAAVVARVWGWCDYSAGVSGAALGAAVGVFLDPRPAGRMADVSRWLIVAGCWAAAALGAVPALLARRAGADPAAVASSFTLGAAVALLPAAGLAWVRLFRPTFEFSLVPFFALMYQTRGTGPGLRDFPRTGPCLVIANHACWFDPVFLGQVIPRPITPMMTSAFFDLPGLRWLMVNVFHTIRVEEKPLKTDVPPEITEAIAALDRGECVVLFPEGYLRRTDAKPLRRFGRGVWQILSQRPDTPVYACWIEGGWGSFTSYANGGTPTKNKRPDVLRRIGVAVPEPVLAPPDELKAHIRTRLGMMNRVQAARALLGLPELPRHEVPARGEEKDDE
jgi:1-acyl-sn-glycerol-3-phosphate acyltransferase